MAFKKLKIRDNIKLIALVVGLILIGTLAAIFIGDSAKNPPDLPKPEVVKEAPRIELSKEQEVALGQQAAPQLALEFGGLSADEKGNALVTRVGKHIVASSAAKDGGWQFEFHLLGDENLINAYALPGGQVYVTAGLLNRMKTEGELAAVLAHEIAHVVGRHATMQLSKKHLGAAPPSVEQLTLMATDAVTLRYATTDELEADTLGLRFMSEAGYDPRAMINVMRILAEGYYAGAQVEFFSTHPNPDNRMENIQAAIAKQYPEGVPDSLSD